MLKYGIQSDRRDRFIHWVQGLASEKKYFGRWISYFNERFNIRSWSLIFAYCLVLSSVVFFSFEFSYKAQLGAVAPADIKSPISFQIVDQQATEEKRRAAEADVPAVFDFDPLAYEQVLNRTYRAFREMRDVVRTAAWPVDDAKKDETLKTFEPDKIKFESSIGVEVPQRLYDWLVEEKFSPRVENVIIRALVKWSGRKIVDGQGFDFDDQKPLVIRVVGRKSAVEESTLDRSQIRDIRKISSFTLEGTPGLEALDERGQKYAADFAQLLLIPNLTFNRQETAERRMKAREAVLPVQISVKRNQVIVSEGAVVQPVHIALLNEINQLRNSRHADFIALAVSLLFLILVTVFVSYLRRVTKPKLRLQKKDMYAMGTVLLLIVALTKLFLYLTDGAIISRFGTVVPTGSLLFAAPVAAGPMLVGLMVTSGELVWLFTVFMAIAVSLIADPSISFVYMLVSAIGGIAAARGVHGCQTRNDIYRAGVRTGAVNGVLLAVVSFLQPVGEAGYLHLLSWNVPLGIAGGILSSLVALAFIPLFESIFNYTTDVKLLELANLNHPLMKDMIVKAPGTYHHSLVVGAMCEAGAEEIGANPLLARVMAYYHDIGKMEHAQYFIENQRAGHNPHDHISPHMSKTILVAHVKDGAEMGYRHKLGKAIIDGILQHHGTTLISYFYNRAIEELDESIDVVNEEDFRYPGPKPQFKEAALLMLADSIEAAARSLEEPTPARLTSLVKNIIQNKFLDGQLDQCDLTLRDLSVIETSFNRVILAVYHQRIDYPQNPTQAQSRALLSQPAPSQPKGNRRRTYTA